MIQDKLREMGVILTDEELKKAVEEVKKETSILKSTVSDYELLSIAIRIKGGSEKSDVPPY
jgi:isopropylmalate/homocitrate/citramalate synthase